MSGNSKIQRFALELPPEFVEAIAAVANDRGMRMTEFLREVCIRPVLGKAGYKLPEVMPAGRPRKPIKPKLKQPVPSYSDAALKLGRLQKQLAEMSSNLHGIQKELAEHVAAIRPRDGGEAGRQSVHDAAELWLTLAEPGAVEISVAA